MAHLRPTYMAVNHCMLVKANVPNKRQCMWESQQNPGTSQGTQKQHRCTKIREFLYDLRIRPTRSYTRTDGCVFRMHMPEHNGRHNDRSHMNQTGGWVRETTTNLAEI